MVECSQKGSGGVHFHVRLKGPIYSKRPHFTQVIPLQADRPLHGEIIFWVNNGAVLE